MTSRASLWLAQRFELDTGRSAQTLLPMEGLRGFAVALVFCVHYATLVEPWLLPGSGTSAVLQGLHAIGNAGVDLFFVLSGYLIYGHLITSSPPFRRYFQRRLRRIYPTFLAVFALYIVLTLIRGGDSKVPGNWPDALAYLSWNLLLLPGVLPGEPFIAVAWSLSYEMFYYLAMPAVIALGGLHGRSPGARVAVFCAIGIVGLALAAVFGGPVRLGMFLAGVLLFETLRPGRTAPGAAPGMLALVLSLACMLIPWHGALGNAVRVLILAAGFFVLCWACFSGERHLLSRAFAWTPLRWLGNMSYSYYLLHGLALHAFFALLLVFVVPTADGSVGLGMLLPAFAFTLLPSAVLYIVIERPLSLAPPKSPGERAPALAGSLHR